MLRVAALLLQAAALQRQGPSVKLHSGAVVKGYVQKSLDGDVLAYLNLRYATASRFGKPQPYRPGPSEVIDGTVVNEPCIQKKNGKVIGTEDCLSLAVFVPPTASKPKPVLFFIHGGFLVDGKVSDFVGRLNYMALKADAVVVAIQYRLNILGFMQPFLSVPANRGLRDQIEALHWVGANIDSFGGDPKQARIAKSFQVFPSLSVDSR